RAPQQHWPAQSTIGDLLAAGGTQPAAQTAAAGYPDADRRASDGAQRGPVRRLQGLVPHRGWRDLLSIDRDRRLQPVPAVLPCDRARLCRLPAGIRAALSRVLRAAGTALR